MKDMKRLEAMLAVFEALHVAVLSCCLAIPLLFMVQEFSDTVELLWAAGASLPVLALHIVSRRTESKKILLLVALGLLALCMVVCRTNILRFVYALLIVLQVLIGTLLPRPDGKTLLSVPKFYHCVAPLLLYGLARAVKNEGMILAATTIVVLFVVYILLYTQARRLLAALYDQSENTVFEKGIVRLNTRLMTLFCVVGAAVVILVPLLLAQRKPAESTPLEPNTFLEAFEETTHPTDPPDLNQITLPEGTPVNVTPFTDAVLIFFGVFTFVVIGMVAYAIIHWLRSLRDDKDLHSAPQESDFTVEALDPDEPRSGETPDANAHGWARRIRRLYQRLIHAKADKKTPLRALTPRELELAAALDGPERDTLHSLYVKARYSGAACEKSDYLAAKSAVQALRKEEHHDRRL